MTTIVTRAGKGSPLTNTEMDANLNNLNNDKQEVATAVQKTASTKSAILPSGITSERDAVPAEGYLRYNTELDQFEGYSAAGWGSVGGGATGGAGDDVFYENSNVISHSYTITSGKNAMSAGPVTVADGVTVTVPDGSVYTIV